ncbi:hypothetical protein ACS0TY_027081 [Phlomoides rotata]
MYKSSKEDRDFLSKCFTGQLKEEFPWQETQREIHEACEGRFHVKYRGGDLVLIHTDEENDLERKDLVNISKWFEFIEPWSDSDAHNVRLVWTHWFGIPMHAWNQAFFKLISLKFGKLLKVDKRTLSRANVHGARLLLKTPLREIPRDPFPVMVDERKFFIRIREEMEHADGINSNWLEGGIWDSEEENGDWWRSDEDDEEDQELEEFDPELRFNKKIEGSESLEAQPPATGCMGKDNAEFKNIDCSVPFYVEDRDILNAGENSETCVAQNPSCRPKFMDIS